MPIFEYRCSKCGHEFETLVTGASKPECPKCGAEKLEKKFSVFSAQTATPGPKTTTSMPIPCGSCGDPRGAGSCGFD